jgi:hypothetical protein
VPARHKGAAADIDPASLRALDTAALHDLWRRLHRRPPPEALAGELLVRALAHHVQVARHGGLSSAAKFRLKLAVNDGVASRRAGRSDKAVAGAGTPDAPASRALRPGTRLLREWRGVMHEVVVVPDGYLWQEQVHRSLSSIAKAITGTAWNGWIFFGIKQSAKGAKDDSNNRLDDCEIGSGPQSDRQSRSPCRAASARADRSLLSVPTEGRADV